MKKNKENIKQENQDLAENNQSEREPYENRPLPGEYKPEEDIMNRRNQVERVPLNPENPRGSGDSSRYTESGEEMNTFPPEDKFEEPLTESDDLIRGPSNLTKEDFEALGPRDLSLDMGEDEQLKQRTWPVDFSASDLDVPTGETGKQDAMDQGDEENDHYSLGGDEKDSLEDDPTRTFG